MNLTKRRDVEQELKSGISFSDFNVLVVFVTCTRFNPCVSIACVHVCISVLSMFYSASRLHSDFCSGLEWDIQETYSNRQDGPLRFLKHCFAMFY